MSKSSRKLKKVYSHKLTLFCLLPLLLGGLIYILFRPNTLLMFHWFELMSIGDEVEIARKIFAPLYPFIPEPIIFSLPFALWSFSLAWFLELVWNQNNNKKLSDRIFWLTLIISLGLECLPHFYQSLGWFCVDDVMWIFISLVLFKIIRSVENDWKIQ